MQIIKLIILGVGLLFIFQAEAQTEHNSAEVVGAGCSAKNVEVALTQNQTILEVGLQEFAVESGRSLGRRLDRKSCQVSMPVKVEQGYQVAVSAVNYKGYTQIPAGGMARIEIETALGGVDGLKTDRIFSSQFDSKYQSSMVVKADDLQWSACGENADIKVKTTMLIQSNNRMDSASAVMDGRDQDSKIRFNLSWRKCQ